MGASTVTAWIGDRAHALTTLDAKAPLADLEPLRATLDDAAVVALGRSTHGTRELTAVTHRILRLLVEQMGFRSLAVEEDWTTGVAIDKHVVTGDGDPQKLLDDASPHYRTQEFLDVIGWMRSHNERHLADPVRFVGLDVARVRALAYDAVIEYVRGVAPERLDELATYYSALRPAHGIDEHIEWYRNERNKQPRIDDARRALELVADLPAAAKGHALALQHARAIVGFYETLASGDMGEVEQHLADNSIWWHEQTGHRIVYWGGFPHTAVARARRVSFPPSPPVTHRNAGSYLRDHFGKAYVSIGLTFDHGSVRPGPVPVAVPAPAENFADAVLGGTGLNAYMLDLRTDHPPTVRAWLETPAKLRLVGPGYDPSENADNYMSGGSVARWFDILVHVRQVTPTRPVVSQDAATPAPRTRPDDTDR